MKYNNYDQQIRWLEEYSKKIDDPNWVIQAQERLDLGEPIQYIIGEWDFCFDTFYVSPHVLIPRPETEFLVEKIIDYNQDILKDRLKIVDCGTGSGAIGCSLARKFLNSKIILTDISMDALKVAKKNVNRLNLQNIEIINTNILDGISQQVDIIVSNPPYGTEEEYKNMEINVTNYEPKLAIVADNNGLDIYEKLIPQSHKLLTSNGQLWLEIGETQGTRILELMKQAGFVNCNVLKDLAVKDRYIFGQKS